MDFSKYNSIENSYRQREVEKIELQFGNQEFFVQEKVHGSNFSFWTDGTEVKCAKRSGFITEGENFFNSSNILAKYKDNILALHKLCDCDVLTVFGEVYGGSYPHDDVPECNVSKVQRGVYYNPDVDFIAFDVRCDDEYLGLNRFRLVCDITGTPYLKTLLKGTFRECLGFSNEYQTTIPSYHDLPEIENNICEGNVIRPTTPLFFNTGSRVILKNKNDKFSEKENKKEAKPQKEIPAHILELRSVGQQYVNENRLRNVLSKVGEVDEKGFGKLMGMLSKDSLEDFIKDTPAFSELEKSDQKLVTKYVNAQCANLIRPNFLNIVDGNY